MTPSSHLPLLAAVLLNAAHIVAPNKDKLWIADMRLEAAFVEGKVRFALSALGLALKFRWEVLRHRPATLAFASVALAAMATLLFVPRIFDNAPTNNAAMSAPGSYETASEYAQDVAESRGIVADAQEDSPDPQTTSSGADQVGEGSPQTSQGAVAEVPATPPAAITPAPQAELPTDTPESLNQAPMATVPAPSEPSSDATTLSASEAASQPSAVGEAASTPDAASGAMEENESNTLARLSIPAPLTPSPETTVVSTPVLDSSVALEATSEALLTIYSGSDFAGNPRVHRYLGTGETLTFFIPFSLYTDNAAAITVTVDGSSFALGEEAEEQFRVFTKP